MPPTRTRPRGTTRRVQPFQGRPPAARRPARHRRCRCRTSCMTNGSDARSPVCCRPMRLQPQLRVFASSSSPLPPFARTWLRQDARDAVAGRARHPDRPVADRDPDARFARPDGDWPAAYLPGASVDPGHGPVPPVCDPDAAIRESPGPTAGRAVTCGSRRPGRKAVPASGRGGAGSDRRVDGHPHQRPPDLLGRDGRSRLGVGERARGSFGDRRRRRLRSCQ